MKKFLLIAVAVLLAGCNAGQKIEGGLRRQYDKENGVACYTWFGDSTNISCVKVK